MKKYSRTVLTKKIIEVAKLPSCKSTKGYFTREQLVELLLFINKQHEIIRRIGEESGSEE